MSDMKLHVATMDTFFYPDVIVSCHKKDHQAEQYLSDSTEAYDRGARFAAYRR
jgi:hypothetical protein